MQNPDLCFTLSKRERLRRKGEVQMRRFFEMLNTPMAVLVALFVVVAVNSFLYFGYYSPRTPTPSSHSLPPEHTHSPTKLEETTSAHMEETTSSSTKSPPSTTAPTTTTVTATATATATP